MVLDGLESDIAIHGASDETANDEENIDDVADPEAIWEGTEEEEEEETSGDISGSEIASGAESASAAAAFLEMSQRHGQRLRGRSTPLNHY